MPSIHHLRQNNARLGKCDLWSVTCEVTGPCDNDGYIVTSVGMWVKRDVGYLLVSVWKDSKWIVCSVDYGVWHITIGVFLSHKFSVLATGSVPGVSDLVSIWDKLLKISFCSSWLTEPVQDLSYLMPIWTNLRPNLTSLSYRKRNVAQVQTSSRYIYTHNTLSFCPIDKIAAMHGCQISTLGSDWHQIWQFWYF